MPDETQYERYVEVFRITEWKNGAIFKTESEGHQWVRVGAPHPGYVHAPAIDEFAQNNMTIRKVRRG